MAGLALLALLTAGSAGLLLQAVSAASKAATAADLSALAAADTARGLAPGDPCAVAATVAARHGALVQDCLMGEPGDGTVTIRVTVGVLGVLPDATGAARAGPPR